MKTHNKTQNQNQNKTQNQNKMKMKMKNQIELLKKLNEFNVPLPIMGDKGKLQSTLEYFQKEIDCNNELDSIRAKMIEPDKAIIQKTEQINDVRNKVNEIVKQLQQDNTLLQNMIQEIKPLKDREESILIDLAYFADCKEEEMYDNKRYVYEFNYSDAKIMMAYNGFSFEECKSLQKNDELIRLYPDTSSDEKMSYNDCMIFENSWIYAEYMGHHWRNRFGRFLSAYDKNIGMIIHHVETFESGDLTMTEAYAFK